jgi:hypothetical protein
VFFIRGDLMELDSKQKVLYAIYAEYQRDLPDMKSVTFKSLDMDLDVYQVALIKLQNEELIDGLVIVPPKAIIPSRIKGMDKDNILPTSYGIEYVESKFDIQKDKSSKEKLNLLKEKFGKLGWCI